ncbi:MAG: hypothetical protein COY69_01930 [Candidatus Magasanikbacteria bacterium CG_4_10_14_0_8_um_filter_32_14]|uniref:Glycosyltransferase RgtA/B/C/D-like domain-containing protein n=2 Tax=Candidatus Magasanikiibacteriota TaxID=1752731 RepID=A0A2M7R9C5_9BACT|nr:MAG: hypothetical protein AUJ23_03150 [Candidatus Magasanikbacteria bacterium CG1_02_32_51]PIY93369.1 MAG: hypothetical protein COY69_01930 [Candidatus Magasanikbacteria bacterium CG_4_10_14_0_8_um_filter_32_14]
MILLKNKIFLLTILSLVLIAIPFPISKFVGFLSFLFFTSQIWKNNFSAIFAEKFSVFVYFLLGFFSVFSLLGLVSSIFVVYYTLNSSLIIYPFIITSFLTFVFCYKNLQTKEYSKVSNYFQENNYVKSLIVFFMLLFFLGIFILSQNISVVSLSSPWQTIPFVYLFIFFVLSSISGILLYLLHNKEISLFIFIILAFFVHIYLPMSHTLPWGGDVWRHMAVEQKMINGDLELPVIFGKEALSRSIFGLPVLETFLIPNKYSYGHLWATSIFLSEVLPLDLLQVNKWLVPILWSVFFPIFLYLLSIILFDSKKTALWLVFASTFVFSFQALGAFTLPISFDFILFLFLLFLFFSYIKHKNYNLKKMLFLFLPLLLFQYTLFFLLFIFITFFAFILSRIKFSKIRIVLVSSAVFFIPIFEWITKLSIINTLSDILLNTKQMIGHLSGFTYAIAIRSSDILTGNIFFNHTPITSFVPNIFNIFRWHVVLIMLVVWILFFSGTFYIFLKEERKEWQIVNFLSFLVVGGYIYGWIFFSGDHLFVRRLDPVLALVILFTVFYAIYNIKIFKEILDKKIISFSLIVLTILFGTTAYASGPDMKIVSLDNYNTSQYIYDIVEDDKNYCIISDPWSLLTLEYVSAKSVVGGGFPIDRQFTQPELINIYNSLLNSSFEFSMLNNAFKVTGSKRCFLVVPSDSISLEQKRYLDSKLLGYDLEGFPMYVWMFEKKS